jgi:NTP pyrophosphatase (non-canonical NTP hydrolase)
MITHFPRTTFADKNGLWEQLNHIQSELKELFDAYFNEPSGRVAEEAVDLVHSVETLLHILEERYGVNVDYVRDHVKAKNQTRGYYS